MPTTNKWIRLHKYRTQWHQWSALWTYGTQERIIALHVQTSKPTSQPTTILPLTPTAAHTYRQKAVCIKDVCAFCLIERAHTNEIAKHKKMPAPSELRTKKKYEKLNLKKKMYTTMYLHWKSVCHVLMRQYAIVCVRNSLRIMRKKHTVYTK